MVFNATFKNIMSVSFIGVGSGVLDKTIDLAQDTNKLYHIVLYRLDHATRGRRGRDRMVV